MFYNAIVSLAGSGFYSSFFKTKNDYETKIKSYSNPKEEQQNAIKFWHFKDPLSSPVSIWFIY